MTTDTASDRELVLTRLIDAAPAKLYRLDRARVA